MKRGICFGLLVLTVLLWALVPGTQAQGPGPLPDKFLFKWAPQQPAGCLNSPQGIAVAPNGRIYVADKNNQRIQCFSADGTFLFQWGSGGYAEGQFNYPQDVAVAPDGTVYVVDRNNHRIQRFSPSGAFLGKWGSYGSGAGQFHYPFGIAVDSIGRVYVADRDNHRIQRFSATGEFQRQWGGYGSGDGQFQYPEDVAVAPDDTVYVADTINGRVQRFSARGEFLGKWDTYYPLRGTRQRPCGIAAAPDGTVYVAGSEWVRRYSADGTCLGEWEIILSVWGGWSWKPWGIAVSPDGTFYVADTDGYTVYHFSPARSDPLHWWGGYSPIVRGFFEPASMAVAPDNSVFLAEHYHVLHFSPEGALLRQWYCPGESCPVPGESLWATGVAVTRDGIVLVANTNDYRCCIWRFSMDGAFLGTWCPNLPWWVPLRIAVAPDGTVYAIDPARMTISYLSSTGEYVAEWGSEGSGDGQFKNPRGIAVAPDGTVYVADTGNHRVQRFSATGEFLGKWGGWGSSDGAFKNPEGIAVASDGTVYVADTGNRRIQRFSATGQFLGKWGSQGFGDGQFNSPNCIAIAPDGRVYVADRNNHRVQAFGTTYPSAWYGTYYDNRWLVETPVFARWDAAIDLDWGNGSPASEVPADYFSARWNRYVWLPADTYRFTITADGGVRLWVDDRLLIERWQDGAASNTASIYLSQGYHRLQLEYFEGTGRAAVRLWWASTTIPTPTRTSTPTRTPTRTPTPTSTPTLTPTPTEPWATWVNPYVLQRLPPAGAHVEAIFGNQSPPVPWEATLSGPVIFNTGDQYQSGTLEVADGSLGLDVLPADAALPCSPISLTLSLGSHLLIADGNIAFQTFLPVILKGVH